MRADRLLSVLLLLQVHRQMTARELAERLEVSERTVHRDMEALSAAGVPVVAERGTGGGWRLLEGYETRLTGLNQAEARALFLPRPSRLLDDLGLQQAADAALIRLAAALPAALRPNAEYMRQRIYVDATGWRNSGEDIAFLPVLQEAVWQERRLHLTYERGDGTRVDRLLDPLGLVAKGTVWYLVAAAEGEVRSYRVSRVRSAALTEQPCVRPPDFDLAAYWEQSAAEFVANLPRYDATLRMPPEVLARLRVAARYARVESAGPPEADGWQKVSVRFQFEHEACEYVLGFGPQVEVVAPLSLRERVIGQAQALLSRWCPARPQG